MTLEECIVAAKITGCSCNTCEARRAIVAKAQRYHAALVEIRRRIKAGEDPFYGNFSGGLDDLLTRVLED